MSSVTDIILTTFLNDPGINRVQEFLRETEKNELTEVSKHSGGTKEMQVDVWLGAFNYMDETALVDVVRTAPWKYPECVQLMLKGEHDDRFKVYELSV